MLSFAMPNLRKMEIAIDFNENLGHLCGIFNLLVNCAKNSEISQNIILSKIILLNFPRVCCKELP